MKTKRFILAIEADYNLTIERFKKMLLKSHRNMDIVSFSKKTQNQYFVKTKNKHDLRNWDEIITDECKEFVATITPITKKTKFYIIQKGSVIRGVTRKYKGFNIFGKGSTLEEAWADASHSMENQYDCWISLMDLVSYGLAKRGCFYIGAYDFDLTNEHLNWEG